MVRMSSNIKRQRGACFFSCGIDFQVILIDDVMKLGRMETMLKVSSKILDIYVYIHIYILMISI